MINQLLAQSISAPKSGWSGGRSPNPFPEWNTLTSQFVEQLSSIAGETNSVLIHLLTLPIVNGIIGVTPEATSHLQLGLASWTAGRGHAAEGMGHRQGGI